MPCGNLELSQKLVVGKSCSVPSGPSPGARRCYFFQRTPSCCVQAAGKCSGADHLCCDCHSTLGSILGLGVNGVCLQLRVCLSHAVGEKKTLLAKVTKSCSVWPSQFQVKQEEPVNKGMLNHGCKKYLQIRKIHFRQDFCHTTSHSKMHALLFC